MISREATKRLNVYRDYFIYSLMRVLFIRFAMNGTNARMLATAAAAAGGSGNIGCIAAAVNRFAIDAALHTRNPNRHISAVVAE